LERCESAGRAKQCVVFIIHVCGQLTMVTSMIIDTTGAELPDDPEGFFAPVFRHFQSGLDENYQIGTFYKAS